MTSSETMRYITSNFAESIKFLVFLPEVTAKVLGAKTVVAEQSYRYCNTYPKFQQRISLLHSAGISQTCCQLTDSGERHSHTDCYSKMAPIREYLLCTSCDFWYFAFSRLALTQQWSVRFLFGIVILNSPTLKLFFLTSERIKTKMKIASLDTKLTTLHNNFETTCCY